MIYEGKRVDYVSRKLASDGTLASTDFEQSKERKNRLLEQNALLVSMNFFFKFSSKNFFTNLRVLTFPKKYYSQNCQGFYLSEAQSYDHISCTASMCQKYLLKTRLESHIISQEQRFLD